MLIDKQGITFMYITFSGMRMHIESIIFLPLLVGCSLADRDQDCFYKHLAILMSISIMNNQQEAVKRLFIPYVHVGSI